MGRTARGRCRMGRTTRCFVWGAVWGVLCGVLAGCTLCGEPVALRLVGACAASGFGRFRWGSRGGVDRVRRLVWGCVPGVGGLCAAPCAGRSGAALFWGGGVRCLVGAVCDAVFCVEEVVCGARLGWTRWKSRVGALVVRRFFGAAGCGALWGPSVAQCFVWRKRCGAPGLGRTRWKSRAGALVVRRFFGAAWCGARPSVYSATSPLVRLRVLMLR